MPKKKKFYVNLPRLLIHESLDLIFFGYLMGTKDILPSVEIRRMAEMFMDTFNLSEDDYPLDYAMTNYYRMFKKYVEMRKDFDKT